MPIIYKCPNCGAAMEFSSELQKLECKRCGTSIDVKTYEDEYASLMEEVSGSTSDNSDYGFNNSEQDNDADNNNMKIYHCQSCGAELVADEYT